MFTDWLYDWHPTGEVRRECARFMQARAANVHFNISPVEWQQIEQAALAAHMLEAAFPGEWAELKSLHHRVEQVEYRLNEGQTQRIWLWRTPAKPALPWLQNTLQQARAGDIHLLLANENNKAGLNKLLAAAPSPCPVWIAHAGTIAPWQPPKPKSASSRRKKP